MVVAVRSMVLTSVKLDTSKEEPDRRLGERVGRVTDGVGRGSVINMDGRLFPPRRDALSNVYEALPGEDIGIESEDDDVVVMGERMGSGLPVAVSLPPRTSKAFKDSTPPLFSMNRVCPSGESEPESKSSVVF